MTTALPKTPSFRLDGRRALVTGAGRGIGAAMAAALAEAGAHVTLCARTEAEIEHVKQYMRSEAPDLTVQFVQKVYSENVLNVRHDVWDVHTNVDRWWVITEPISRRIRVFEYYIHILG